MSLSSETTLSLQICHGFRVFPRPFTHGGRQVQGDKALMGGLMRGGHRPYGGDLTLIDYIIN